MRGADAGSHANPSPPRLTGRRAFLAALAAGLPLAAQASVQVGFPFALPDLPGNTKVRPLGGIEIDRRTLGFGGLSGLHIGADLAVTAISDLARFAEFTLVLDEAMRPRQLVLRRRGWLRDGAGRPLTRGYAGDAEALARLPDGSWLVGFERWHRIRRYRDLDGPGAYVEAPPGLEMAPANGGLETLAVLEDGRWLAITEELTPPEAPSLRMGWIGRPGAWAPLAYRPGPGLVPVDASPLPGGGVLVLERGFSLLGGFWGRLVRLPAAALVAGQVLDGEELVSLEAPLPVDNYEGVAAFRHQGRQLVGLVSDDNENRLQRSLLLVFEIF